MTWSSIRDYLSNDRPQDWWQALLRAPGLVACLSDESLRRCSQVKKLVPRQTAILHGEFERRERSRWLAASERERVGVSAALLVRSQGGDEGAWPRCFEDAVPLLFSVQSTSGERGSLIVTGLEELQSPEAFAEMIQEAVAAARDICGDFTTPLKIAFSLPGPLPEVEGGSHGLPVFLQVAFVLRYRRGLPPSLLATGVLRSRRVDAVSGLLLKLALTEALEAEVLVAPQLPGVEARGSASLLSVPPDLPLDEVLGRVERHVFASGRAWLKLSRPRLRARLAWVERVLIDQRWHLDSALEELAALEHTIAAADDPSLSKERVVLLELRARVYSRSGRSAEGMRAVTALLAELERSDLDMRDQWLRVEIHNQYANLWIFACDFDYAREIAKQALSTYERLHERRRASASDVARAQGTLGHVYLYAGRGETERSARVRALTEAKRLFERSLQGIGAEDKPRNQNYLGEVAIDLGDFQGALSHFEGHLDEDQHDPLSTNLGFTLKGLARLACVALEAGTSEVDAPALAERVAELVASGEESGRLNRRRFPLPIATRFLARAQVALGRKTPDNALEAIAEAAKALEPMDWSASPPPLRQGCAAAAIAAAIWIDQAALAREVGQSERARAACARAAELLEAFGSASELRAGRQHLAPLLEAAREGARTPEAIAPAALKRLALRVPT